MSVANELIEKLDKLHTTELGVVRIKRNLSLDVDDVVEWCRDKIKSDNAVITRNGKNWYINIDASIITVNAYSYTIITAHKEKKWLILVYSDEDKNGWIWKRIGIPSTDKF